MRDRKYTDDEINKIIGELTYIIDYLESMGYIDISDTIEKSREMLKKLLTMKQKVNDICNDKS